VSIELLAACHSRRHTGQKSVSECRSGIQRNCQKAQPFAFIFENKEQNASRFGICSGFRLGAR
jgi:hypothetical protein